MENFLPFGRILYNKKVYTHAPREGFACKKFEKLRIYFSVLIIMERTRIPAFLKLFKYVHPCMS